MKLDTLDRRPYLPSRVVQAIQREIIEGRLKLGDRLPGEQVLAGSFGVSRNVIREAIARLRSDGVVESRQGVGAFVVRDAAFPSLHIDPEIINDRALFNDVFELRGMLETRAAGLAAKRGSPQQHAAITIALDHMRKEWNGDLVFLHEAAPGPADRSYGVQVAKLAGVPPAVVARAREVLERLESQAQSPARLDDLPLFADSAPQASPGRPAG